MNTKQVPVLTLRHGVTEWKMWWETIKAGPMMLDQCAVELIEVNRQTHGLCLAMRDSCCALLFC